MASNLLNKGDKFYSHNEFHLKLQEFQNATFTQFSTISAEKLVCSHDLYPTFLYHVIRYQCKQGQRFRETDNKIRKSSSLKVGCPVKMNVRLNRPKGKDPFLKVTNLLMEHEGHEVSRETFQQYPEQRRLQIDEIDTAFFSTLPIESAEQSQVIERIPWGRMIKEDVSNMQHVEESNGGRGNATDLVVFSAALDSLVRPCAGQTLIFPNVQLNFGDGYDGLSGIFTSPKAGLYQFNLSIRVETRDTFIYIRLKKNNESFFSISAGDRDDLNQSSIVSYVTLISGDEVKIYVDAVRGNGLTLSHWNYSVFSGRLLSAF